MKARDVSIAFYHDTYNFKFEAKSHYKKNRRLLVFSLTQKEVEKMLSLLGAKLRKKTIVRIDLNEIHTTGNGTAVKNNYQFA